MTMAMAASEKLRNFEAAEILSKRIGIIFFFSLLPSLRKS